MKLVSNNQTPRSPAPRVPRDYRQHYKLGREIDWDGIAIVAITLVGLCLLYVVGAYWDTVSGAFK